MRPVDTASDVAASMLTDRSKSTVACANCGRVCDGAYCSACGQRQPTGRHTLRSVLGGILDRFISIEHGFALTAIQLTIRPGAVISEYWAGRTIRYTHPAGYLLVSVAVFALALRLFSGPTGAADGDRLFALLIVPMIAGASRVLCWRAAYTYAEHLIAVMYLCGHVMLGLAMLSVGLSFVSGPTAAIYGATVSVLGVSYFLWGYSRAFSERPVLALVAGLSALLVGAAAWIAVVALLVNWLSR